MNEQENKTPETDAVTVENAESNEPPVEEAEEVKTDPEPAATLMCETEHNPKYEKVLGFYKSGAWNEKQVRNAVAKGWITAAEFAEITGKEY